MGIIATVLSVFGGHQAVTHSASNAAAAASVAPSAIVATSSAQNPASVSALPTIINQPVIERIIERTVQVAAPSGGYVTQEAFTTAINELSDRFGRIISGSTYPAPASNFGSGGVWNAVALTNRIDHLSGTDLSDITVDGVSGLTDADIPDGITASNYLPLSGGSLTFASSTLLSVFDGAYFGASATSSFDSAGALTLATPLLVSSGGTGANTFGQGWVYSSGGTGALAASTSPTVNYITATSTVATSSFAAPITITGANAAAGNIQVGRLESRDYGSSNSNNNIVLGAGSTGAPNIRLQVDNTAAHIGLNIGGTPASAFTVQYDGSNTYAGIRGRNYQTGSDSTELARLQMGSSGLSVTTDKGFIGLAPSSGVFSLRGATVNTFPGSGAGLEFMFDTDDAVQEATGRGTILSYDRTGSAFKSLRLNAYDTRIQSSSVDVLTITNGGRVGINTVTPAFGLDVNGISIFREVLNVTSAGLSSTASQDLKLYSNNSANLGITVKSGTANVGLSTTTPWRTLSVTGTVGFDGLTGSTGAGSLCLSANREVVYNSGSDSCLSSTRATKHDILPLDLSALDMVTSLQPVSFIYNNDASSTVRYGFIAEDAAAVDAHLATYDAQGAISGIDDRSVIALTVRAVQSLISTISDFADRFTTRELTFTRATGDEITVRKANIQQANVQELCVGSTCLTESQVQALLNQAGQQPSAPSETPQASEPEEPQADEPILPATAEEPEETDSSIPEASDAPPTVPADTPEDIPVTEPVDPAAQ
ncbi:MAG: tail fiber domain-containing protein [Pseudolabrys sp.]|nr:tail fiber domain-containing protein [Pseudolabrys sp.]MDP2296139.1 tail fiber domain-containing protein [Pseudolabrys sp.]